ncbi:hypothetical protein [Nonomuraea cavernae]|uniref:hypothetical protein n=1 Tax=Nonomuraea cavernae TaxID=2045107 RepID=UPI0016628FF4|nr:hypothetical protein [Nonomuraea cavernae]MCA2184167.1 hypothetical protein [Nonomuraea cavernae]
MFATRSPHFRHPAFSFVRAFGNALIALCLLTCALFTHGGACAALIISETGHAQHAAEPPRADGLRGDACSHGQLPSGHRHGAEPDVATAMTPVPDMPGTLDSLTAHSAVAVRLNVRPPHQHSHRPPTIPPDSRVMRI